MERFEATLTKEAHESWFLGEHKCGVLWFLCPAHKNHLIAVRISAIEAVHSYGGDQYKNIWQYKTVATDEIEISPSINAKDCYHTSIPVRFTIIVGHHEVLFTENWFEDHEWGFGD